MENSRNKLFKKNLAKREKFGVQIYLHGTDERWNGDIGNISESFPSDFQTDFGPGFYTTRFGEPFATGNAIFFAGRRAARGGKRVINVYSLLESTWNHWNDRGLVAFRTPKQELSFGDTTKNVIHGGITARSGLQYKFQNGSTGSLFPTMQIILPAK